MTQISQLKDILGNKAKIKRQEQTWGCLKKKKKASGLGASKWKSGIRWEQSWWENEETTETIKDSVLKETGV